LIFAAQTSNKQHMKFNIYLTTFLILGIMLGCGKKKSAEEKTQQDSTVTNTGQTKPQGVLSGTLTLNQTTFEPGEEIHLNFKANLVEGNNPWVGIIPTTAPHGNADKNDEVDIAYQYLDGKTDGELIFIAPVDTGNFDLRMNSSAEDKKEVTSITFKVKGPANTKTEITTDKKSYAKGEQMVITFKAIPTWDKNAWIGMIPAGTKHGKAEDADKVDVGYVYLNGRSKGVWKVTAPTESNNYSIRLFDAEVGKEVKSVDFTVE
jgi:hypothetical protein